VTAYTVNDGNGGLNYTVTTHTSAGTITEAALTVTFTAADKPHDGGTVAIITGRTVDPVVGTEDVTCVFSGATAAFADKNVGTWDVTGSGFALAGADKANHAITAVNPASAKITASGLRVTKSASAATVKVGDSFSHTIKVEKIGTTDNGAFTLTDELPVEVTFVSVSGPGVCG
jgi:uncharacterized repeat protein (TIGR01451 family)